jgi:small subunit ribosomal protein S6
MGGRQSEIPRELGMTKEGRTGRCALRRTHHPSRNLRYPLSLPKGSLPRLWGLMSTGSDMNNRKYEAFYIVKPDLADADVQKIADRFKGVVEDKGGTVEKAGKWDKRKLAYELNGFKEGNYVLMNFEAPAALPKELNRLMQISDDIIRHRIYSIEE